MAKLTTPLQAASKRLAFWIEHAVLDFTFSLEKRMKAEEDGRTELARRLGTSPAYVTKILSGNANFTIKSMVSVCHALGAKIKIEIVPIAEETRVPSAIRTREQAPQQFQSMILRTSVGPRVIVTGNIYQAANDPSLTIREVA